MTAHESFSKSTASSTAAPSNMHPSRWWTYTALGLDLSGGSRTDGRQHLA